MLLPLRGHLLTRQHSLQFLVLHELLDGVFAAVVVDGALMRMFPFLFVDVEIDGLVDDAYRMSVFHGLDWAGGRRKGNRGVGELGGLGAAEHGGLAEVGRVGVELRVVEGDVVHFNVDIDVNIGIVSCWRSGTCILFLSAVVDLWVHGRPVTSTCTANNVFISSSDAILQSTTVLRSWPCRTTATITIGHAAGQTWTGRCVSRGSGTLEMSRPAA